MVRGAAWVSAILLGSVLIMSPALRAQQGSVSGSVPDAPAPQTPKLSDVNGPITPGLGAGKESSSTPANSDSDEQQAPPSSEAPSTQGKDNFQTAAPSVMNAADLGTVLHTSTTEVIVPVTVKDNKGKLVPGLTWRDFKIFENNTREHISYFSVDAAPLSIAFVIDQSLTSDVMSKVNASLDAIQGALTPFDELALFTYGNGPQNVSGGFTGAQTKRVPFLFSMARASGTDEQVPVNSGPLAGCPISKNGSCVDPNIQPGRSAGDSTFITIPKEIHTLNDAILAAGKELSRLPRERRRIIYVISDGKEYGSKASVKEVIRYLETNNVTVYGTLVGTSAAWGEGRLNRIHLPFTMYDNVLYKYIAATGGQADSERNLNGIEKSYADIADDARNQYTIIYTSHESVYDSKFRKIDVVVNRPGLAVTAKTGYYPSAQMSR